MRDSLKKIGKGHAVHEEGELGLSRHITKTGMLEDGMTSVLKNQTNDLENGNGGSGTGLITTKNE